MKQEEKQETMKKKAAKEYGLKNIDIKLAEKNVFKFFTADKSITYFCHNNGVIDVTERARRGHKADAVAVSKAEPKSVRKTAVKPVLVKKTAKTASAKTEKATGKGSAEVSKAPKPTKAPKTAAKKTAEGKTTAKVSRTKVKTSDNSDIKTTRAVKTKPKADAADAKNAEKTVIVKDADDDDKLYETSAPKTKYNFKRGQCVKDVYGGKEYTVLSVTKGLGSLARLVENSTGFDCTVAVADLVPGKGKPREIEE